MLDNQSPDLYDLLTENLDADNVLSGLIESIFDTTDFSTISKYYDTNEVSHIIQNNINNLFIVQINARSLSKNFDKLKILLSSLHSTPDIIGISETWLLESNTKKFDIDGYNSYHICRPYEAYGGVGTG